MPERDEVLARVHNQARRLLRATENQLTIRRLQLRGAQAALISPQATLEQAHLRLEDKSSALQRTLATRLNDERAHLGYLQRHLRTLGPLQAIAGAQQRLTSGRQNLARATRDKLEERTNQLTYLRRYLHGHNPSNRIRGAGTQLEQLYRGLVRAMQQRVTQARTDLGSTARILHNLSPLPTLERGYAIARDRDGAIINNAANVNVGDDVDTWLARGKISARVTAVDPDAQPGG
ncbi:MAG: exodeoxyribonuclease VII large subunit [Pseudomonadota bacterium]